MIMIGPLRCFRSSRKDGSVKVLSGSRFRSVESGKGTRRPAKAPSTSRMRRHQHRTVRTEVFGNCAPCPAAPGHAAEHAGLIQRKRPADDPTRCGQLDRDVEQRQRHHPTATRKQKRRAAETSYAAQRQRDAADRKGQKCRLRDAFVLKPRPQAGIQQRTADSTQPQNNPAERHRQRPRPATTPARSAATAPESRSPTGQTESRERSPSIRLGDIAT